MLDAHINQVKHLLDSAGTTETKLYSHAYAKHADQTVKFNKVAITALRVGSRLYQAPYPKWNLHHRCQ